MQWLQSETALVKECMWYREQRRGNGNIVEEQDVYVYDPGRPLLIVLPSQQEFYLLDMVQRFQCGAGEC